MTPAAFSLEPAMCVMMDIKGPFVIMVYIVCLICTCFQWKTLKIKGIYHSLLKGYISYLCNLIKE